MAVGLAACRPLYAPSATVSQATNRATVRTAAVTIATIPGRVGQRLRNELLFRLHPDGAADVPQYRLEIAIRESVASRFVRITGETTANIYTLQAGFKLISLSDNKVLLASSSRARAAFDKFKSGFANIRARIDAEDRAAREVADDITTRVAAFLADQS